MTSQSVVPEPLKPSTVVGEGERDRSIAGAHWLPASLRRMRFRIRKRPHLREMRVIKESASQERTHTKHTHTPHTHSHMTQMHAHVQTQMT